jgi:hypothetical protein
MTPRAQAVQFPSLFDTTPTPEPAKTPATATPKQTRTPKKTAPAKDATQPTEEPKPMAETHSIFKIDAELDGLFDEMQGEIDANGEISEESRNRFAEYLDAYGEKIDRIGRFLRATEAVAEFTKKEADRLSGRSRSATSKVAQTKSMLLFFMNARNLKKLEGKMFGFRAQRNGQEGVRVTNEAAIPMAYKRIEAVIDGPLWETIVNSVPPEHRLDLVQSIKGSTILSEAIKEAKARKEDVPGVEVYRGQHVRVA